MPAWDSLTTALTAASRVLVLRGGYCKTAKGGGAGGQTGKDGVLLGEQWGLDLPPNTTALWLVAPGSLE